MKRSPGRPPLNDDEDSVPVHVKMTAAEYDATYERAKLARVTVPEQIRRDVRKAANKKT